jgi:hypothetical protein
VTIGNGQDKTSLHGKVRRIDVKGDPCTVPKDNPFVGNKDYAPEIWASGLRNLWRCAFDIGGSKELFRGDVGENSFEEINIIPKGGNYGWRAMEGDHRFDYVNPSSHPASCDKTGMTAPIIEYKNCWNPAFASKGDCEGVSIMGGYVYRGPHQAWDGAYFFGDWSFVHDGRRRALRRQAQRRQVGEGGRECHEHARVRRLHPRLRTGQPGPCVRDGHARPRSRRRAGQDLPDRSVAEVRSVRKGAVVPSREKPS